MKKQIAVAVLGAALFSATAWIAPARAGAQDIETVCRSLEGAQTGDWAKFDLHGQDAAGVSAVRFAIVKSDPSGGIWYELNATTPQGDQVVQLLVPSFPFKPAQIQAVVTKTGSAPAMKVPEQMLAMIRQQMGSNSMADLAEQCRGATLEGEESVDVPAGTFDAWHVVLTEGDGQGDFWVSSDVPFGIVKGSRAGSGEMVLAGYGEDAKSSITETPREMPAMPGGAGQQN